MNNHKKILVAMSGGIDSTIAAILLHKEGYHVIGVTMKTWDHGSTNNSNKKLTGCCNTDSFNDARKIAVDMGFPHYILDLRNEFNEKVIKDFIHEYMQGRTPNPCIQCNTHIKWNALLKKADLLGCSTIATGHYASVKNNDGRYFIQKSIDDTKDQSYALWGLSQEVLKRTVFPLNGFKKSDIKNLAHKLGYKELSRKNESYEICFIPDNDYRQFLKNTESSHARKVRKGDFLDKHGNIIGKHKGYPYYTIGQRKKLNIALGKPAYVTNINPNNNTITLGDYDDLNKIEMQVCKINFQKFNQIKDGFSASVMIRYNSYKLKAKLYNKNENIIVKFNSPATGVTPGQSAVFYDGNDVIGGGIIIS